MSPQFFTFLDYLFSTMTPFVLVTLKLSNRLYFYVLSSISSQRHHAAISWLRNFSDKSINRMGCISFTFHIFLSALRPPRNFFQLSIDLISRNTILFKIRILKSQILKYSTFQILETLENLSCLEFYKSLQLNKLKKDFPVNMKLIINRTILFDLK